MDRVYLGLNVDIKRTDRKSIVFRESMCALTESFR